MNTNMKVFTLITLSLISWDLAWAHKGGLTWSTFLGGSGEATGEEIAVDDVGCAPVTGETASTDFPTTAGAFDPTYNGGCFYGDVFVANLRLGRPVSVVSSNSLAGLPKGAVLFQNHPNPFNPTTQIKYGLPAACHVRPAIYNIFGQRIATLVDEHQTAGSKAVSWDGGSYASGVYLYRLQAGEYEMAKRMVLLR